MHLIVGLGNPGPKYAGHRHNIGFVVVDELAARWGGGVFRKKFKGLYLKTEHRGQDVVLLKPLTYMNLSGESVGAAMKFFQVPLQRVVCVHDELDLPFGVVKLKIGGGTAGHNGLRSMVQHAGPEFVRCRMGIGRPQGSRPVDGYVLSDFSKTEQAEVGDWVDKAVDVLGDVLLEGATAAMNRHH